MTDQYFSSDPHSRSNPESLDILYNERSISFITDAGVFSKGKLDDGSKILLSALPEKLPGRMLDLGCGWGVMGIIIGVFHPETQIVMSDINPRALALAQKNAATNHIAAECYLSDGFENIPGNFDFIVTNPPIRAGKQTIYRLLSSCKNQLKSGGEIYLVIRKQQGAPSAVAYLKSLFAFVTIVHKNHGYWIIKCQGESHGI